MGNKTAVLLKKLKEKHDASDEIYYYVYPAGSRLVISYGLCKIYKTKVNDVVLFCSIL